MTNNFYADSEYTYVNGKNDNYIKPHKIPDRLFSFCVAVYVEDGSFFAETGGKRYTITKGQTIFIPSFIPHTVGTEENSIVTFAHFSCSYLSVDVFRFWKSNCIISENERLREPLREMNSSAGENVFLSKIRVDKAICDIVLTLQSEHHPDVLPEETDIHLYKALSFIKQNLSRGIGASEVIAECGYKKTTFYKLFTEKMNMTPHDYIERERMKLATLMLAEGKKVKEIATATGYGDEFYFIKKFKKVVGKTPTQYKKSMEEMLYGNEKGK